MPAIDFLACAYDVAHIHVHMCVYARIFHLFLSDKHKKFGQTKLSSLKQGCCVFPYQTDGLTFRCHLISFWRTKMCATSGSTCADWYATQYSRWQTWLCSTQLHTLSTGTCVVCDFQFKQLPSDKMNTRFRCAFRVHNANYDSFPVWRRCGVNYTRLDKTCWHFYVVAFCAGSHGLQRLVHRPCAQVEPFCRVTSYESDTNIVRNWNCNSPSNAHTHTASIQCE